jgi:hypothetical protein
MGDATQSDESLIGVDGTVFLPFAALEKIGVRCQTRLFSDKVEVAN